MTAKSSPFTDMPGARAPLIERARFAPGDIVRHRMFDFRGVVFDVDPVFSNSEEWYEAIPEAIRPAKEQPFYHLMAESDDSSYIAYVSQQNLVADGEAGPVDHPQLAAMFDGLDRGRYRVRAIHRH
ncbi:heat shock protein HspQ [Sphingopyxis granuli]|jgi:heat shock protein HspQ|uniref:Heat shock protein HspQ n=1 Tax=Sphingopyxis granuli TaxID=267128 RepID=A0AA86GM25_9SPHN|nr:Hemimethylated DNA-binding region [Sphingopyxis granuli]